MSEKRSNSCQCCINPFLLVTFSSLEKLILPKIRNRWIVADITNNMIPKCLITGIQKHRHFSKRILRVLNKCPQDVLQDELEPYPPILFPELVKHIVGPGIG